jgi:hypothetical protein
VLGTQVREDVARDDEAFPWHSLHAQRTL